jgi:pantetheine-phosphate adenylyltransferase
VYPGSFDPVTNGHLDIITRSLACFATSAADRLVVAVADNPRKTPLFTVAERKAHIAAAIRDPRLEVDSFEGLLIEYVKRRGAAVVVRGLRALADFEFEFQLAHMNRRLAPEVETLFMMTGEKDFFVSSSLVKEVAQFGGDVSMLVPPAVHGALAARLAAGRGSPAGAGRKKR